MIRLALLMLVGCARPVEWNPVVERMGDLFRGSHGITVGPLGSVLASDTFSNRDSPSRVYRQIASQGLEWEPTPITGTQLSGLEVVDGQLYVCDTGANEVRVYDADLNLVKTYGASVPWNVAVVDGQIYSVAATGAIERLTDTVPEVVETGLKAPFDILVYQDTYAFVSEQISSGDDGRVALRGRDGKIAGQLVHGFGNPEGMSYGPGGRLWVADTLSQELVAFDPDSGALQRLIEISGMPIALTQVPDTGDVLVTVTGEDPSWWRIRQED